MRLGKDVLEADLYAALDLLPDATESEIRASYRRKVRLSHPDLNRDDPQAEQTMARLNVAARVLLDAALRRAYDRGRKPPSTATGAGSEPARRAEWFERREQSSDDDWCPPRAEPRERASFGNFFGELRSREGQLSLKLQELTESLSARQQLGVAALLFAVAIGLIAMAKPQGLIGDSVQPTSVNVGSVYP